MANARQQTVCGGRLVTLGQVGRALLLKHWQRALRHEAGARTGADIEDVHRMRVATRRLRSAFRFFGAYMALPRQDEIVAGLRDLARRLGAVRDLDVLIERLEQEAAVESADRPTIDAIIAALDQDRAVARDDLVAYLDGPGMATLRAHVADGLTQPASGPPAKRDRPVRTAGPRLLARRAARVLADGADLLAPTSEELHDLRIRLKRLRYAAEFLLPYTEGNRLKPLIRSTTALQDVLGELHDGDVMLDMLRGLVASASERSENGVVLPGVVGSCGDPAARPAGRPPRHAAAPVPQFVAGVRRVPAAVAAQASRPVVQWATGRSRRWLVTSGQLRHRGVERPRFGTRE